MWPLVLVVQTAMTYSNGHSFKNCWMCNMMLGEFYNKGRTE